MTLCIGAICRGRNGKRAAVLSSDHQVTSYHYVSDYEYKWGSLTPHWMVLVAGDLSLGREFSFAIKSWLESHGDLLTRATVLEGLREPLNHFRNGLYDHYTQRVSGMPKCELFGAKGKVPDDFLRDVWASLAHIEFDVQLLLFGVVDGEIRLYRIIAAEDRVEECANYGAIGSGAPLAEPWLSFRGYHEAWRVEEALFAVYEAQQFGEKAPLVGRECFIKALEFADGQLSEAIAMSNKSVAEILKKYYARFRRFKPSRIPYDVWNTASSKDQEDDA